MVYFEQLVTSFIASAAFVVLFNAPKESLFKCGLSGMFGWIVYFVLNTNGFGPIIGTLAAAFLIALISRVFAMIYKMPIIIFSVAGIIPLVPGGLAYDTMRNIVENNYTAAVALGVKASMISGAIAVGLIFSEVLNHFVKWPSIHGIKGRH